MPEWPTYVHIAADTMGYDLDEPEGQAKVISFSER
jgi:hypothetical protein